MNRGAVDDAIPAGVPAIARAVLDYLWKRGVDAELLLPGVPMPTVPLAAAAIGVHETEIIKSLLFCDKRGLCVRAIASGAARIDRERLATVTGLERLRLADPQLVQMKTGFPAGGVSPVAHATPVRVVIDRRAAELDMVYGGGGAEEVLLRISPRDIIRLTNAEVAEITIDDDR
jgi:Cys-tRNA(Pro) deacylase